MNILKDNVNTFEKKNRRNILLTSLSVALILIMDILFIIFRNDNNHVLFLVISLVLSLLVTFITIFVIENIIVPNNKLVKLYKKANNNQKEIIEIKDISLKTTNINGFTTYRVSYISNDSNKECYIIEDTLPELKEGKYRVNIYQNIIVEANEYEE